MEQRQDAQIAEAAANTGSHCGAEMTAAIERPGFLPHKDKLPFVTGDCKATLDGIYQMCNDPLAKQAVAKRIKTLACVYGGGAKQSLALDKLGRLTLSIDLDGANYSTFVQKWLGDHL